MILLLLACVRQLDIYIEFTDISATGTAEFVIAADGRKRLAIAEISGDLYIVDWETKQKTPWFSVISTEMGNIQFHPNFHKNGRVFVSYVNNGTSAIDEWMVDPIDASNPVHVHVLYKTESYLPIVIFPFLMSDQSMFFGIGTPYPEVARNLSEPTGKVHRIDIDGADWERGTAYRIPEDNPYFYSNLVQSIYWTNVERPSKPAVTDDGHEMLRWNDHIFIQNGPQTNAIVGSVVYGGSLNPQLVNKRLVSTTTSALIVADHDLPWLMHTHLDLPWTQTWIFEDPETREVYIMGDAIGMVVTKASCPAAAIFMS